jgi:hypothetical protein
MNNSDGECTDDHCKEQTCNSKRNSDCDSCTYAVNALTTLNEDDSGSDGCKSSVRRNSSADVGPAESDHLKLTAENEAGTKLAGNDTDQCAGYQRLMEFELVENTFNTGQECHKNY